jgi:DNA-binding beta-propeller fold protein YncE
MRHTEHNHGNQPHKASRRILGVLCAFLTAGLLSAASAGAAGYEQVADFGKNELQGATGLAVNTTGAGGVPAGTFYAVSGQSRRVARYDPDGEFREAWGWGVGNGAAEFQRCGPDGEVAHPTCELPFETLPPGEGAGQLLQPFGVAVQQSSGNVYVLDSGRNAGVVQVFSADGSSLVASFGERGVTGESFNEGPGKIHRLRPSGIAVSNGGVAYVSDWKPNSVASGEEERVMVFEAGVYAGREDDIAPFPTGPRYAPVGLATDASGNLYTRSEEAIYEFAPGGPTTPVCKFKLAGGGIQGMTVDQVSGAPFYFSTKGKAVHQLSACDAGEFKEVGTIPVSPATSGLVALAFDPSRVYEVGRPPGVLYGADGAVRPGEEGIGHIFAQAVSHLPSVEGESVSGVGASSATLEAEVNPEGENTTYAFQYLSEAAYQANEPSDRFAGASEAPTGGAPLGGGLTTLPVSIAISGLSADTAYRFRVVATNSEGTSEGVAKALHTYPAGLPALPEGRAYERVSPIDKHGGEPFPLRPELGSCGGECKPGVAAPGFPRQISADGEAIVYSGNPFDPGEGAAVYNEYLSRRTDSGWQTTNLSPPLLSSNQQGYKGFNSDLSEAVIYQVTPSLSASAPFEYANVYRQPSSAPGTLSPLLTSPPLNRPPGNSLSSLLIAYAGASADFSHLFFAANDALEGVSPPAVDGGAGKKNLYEYFGGTLRLVNVQPDNSTTVPGAFFGAKNQFQGESSDLSHAISDDGSRVFWSSESGQVYVRKDGSVTEEIPDASGRFLTASADGSRLLLNDGLLFDVDDLGQAPIDLSEGEGGFAGIVGQSDDLTTVYFIDTAVLDAAPNGQGAAAQAGEPNLYAWQEGTAARYVATLVSDDSSGGASINGTWTASPANRLAEASPDGRRVAFLSKAALISGFDNTGPCELIEEDSEVTFEHSACTEVYLYDSLTDTLSCPSCNPTGEAPHGRSTLPLIPVEIGRQEALPQPFYLSDSGHLYFDSQDSLSPLDTNGNVEDVYQYLPSGVEGCVRAGGCVSLISSGHGSGDSNFLATDPAGENVFFTTRDKLVPSDRDDLVDVYDARKGGGFPAETEVARGECQGEACQPPIVVPNDPTPASSSFAGAGNVEEKKHAKKHAKKHKKQKKKKRNAKRAAKHDRGGVR